MKLKEKLRDLHPYQKRLLRLLCVVLATFVLYNIIWLAYRETRFGDYKDAVGYSETYQTWSTTRDGFYYNVIQPDYPFWNGYLSTANAYGEGLNIRLAFPNENTYTVTLCIETTIEANGLSREMTNIAVDENGNWDDTRNRGYGARERALFDERQADIQSWLAQANEVWDLPDG